MNKAIILSLIIITLLFVTGCNLEYVRGDGNVVKSEITTEKYDGVDVRGSLDVIITKGEEGTINVKGEENIIEILEIYVEDNTLVVTTKSGVNYSTTEDLIIKVPVETISEITLSGSGDINAKKTIDADELDVDLSGSGDIDINVNAEKITAKLSGSGDIELDGKTTDLECEILGSGDIKAEKLKANNVDASISGSGNITVHAKSSISATVNGTGSVHYKGDPEVESTVNGSGKVSRM